LEGWSAAGEGAKRSWLIGKTLKGLRHFEVLVKCFEVFGEML